MSGLLRPAAVLFAAMTLVTGMLYPLAMAAIGQAFFARQAAGSLITQGGTVIGSSLIGQTFDDPRYFWGRPSATAQRPNNASASGGSNFAATNPALIESVRTRLAALKAADPSNRLAVPVDLVTASGSGLDPHISPAAALYQVTRVARARGLDPLRLRRQVVSMIEPPQWQVLGEPRLNVLMLNLALDRAQ